MKNDNNNDALEPIVRNVFVFDLKVAPLCHKKTENKIQFVIEK